MNTCAKTLGGWVAGPYAQSAMKCDSNGRARDATAGNAKASYDSRNLMRGLAASAVLYWLLILAAICATGAADLAPGSSDVTASAFAKEKPLSWKPIESALLRVNDAPPKDWEVYRTGKKNVPLLLQIGNRFLLLEINQHQVLNSIPRRSSTRPGSFSGVLLIARISRSPLPIGRWTTSAPRSSSR